MSTDHEQGIDPDRLAAVLDQVSRWGRRGQGFNDEVCTELRRRRHAGQAREDACADLPIDPGAATYHSTGLCACTTDIPPIAGRSNIVTERDCYDLRGRWMAGESLPAIADSVQWTLDTVKCHALGWAGCSHRSEGDR